MPSGGNCKCSSMPNKVGPLNFLLLQVPGCAYMGSRSDTKGMWAQCLLLSLVYFWVSLLHRTFPFLLGSQLGFGIHCFLLRFWNFLLDRSDFRPYELVGRGVDKKGVMSIVTITTRATLLWCSCIVQKKPTKNTATKGGGAHLWLDQRNPLARQVGCQAEEIQSSW